MSHRVNQALLLTPPGGAAIAVVRITGPDVLAFVSRYFSKIPRPYRAVHGELSDGEKVLDDPVIVMSADGEIADVNLHGGPWVVRSVLELARKNGFDEHQSTAQGDHAAQPLPPEAVDADTDLEQAILTHLPLARTELGVRALLAQKQAWKRPWENVDAALQGLERMRNDRSLWWLLNPPRVAIIGRPNVGKSTLANQLFAQERSITADVPGTTRDWVGEIADVDGLPVMLVDTPGLRQTDDPIEAEAIARAGGQIASADLVIVVVDASQCPDETALWHEYPDAIVCLNKYDRVSSVERGKWPGAIRTIATSGQGIAELRAAITTRFGCNHFDVQLARFWTLRPFAGASLVTGQSAPS